jgi:hypothetical protein
VLLLALLFGGALYNIHYMDRLALTLTDELEDARADVGAGDFVSAEKKVRSAIDLWMSSDGYTHIFIRHPEIDSATDAFYELLSDVASKDAPSSVGSFEKVEAHLQSIATMEHVTIGSIL